MNTSKEKFFLYVTSSALSQDGQSELLHSGKPKVGTETEESVHLAFPVENICKTCLQYITFNKINNISA